jgi:hypothetical protein
MAVSTRRERRCLGVIPLFTGLAIIALSPCFGADNTMKLQATAVAYRVVPHERTVTFQTAGQSDTSCYGSGTYTGFHAGGIYTGSSTATMNCTTVTTPPKERPITIRSIEVFNQVEAGGQVLTLRCTAHWAGSSCTWLTPGDVFEAEIKSTSGGTTVWVSARKGGNMGEAVRAKFELLDMRPRPTNTAAAAKNEAAVAKQEGSDAPQADTWERSRECADQAERTVAEMNRRAIAAGGSAFTEWSNHYSPKYARCFVRALATATEVTLIDAFERSVLAVSSVGACRIDGNDADCSEVEQFIADRTKN